MPPNVAQPRNSPKAASDGADVGPALEELTALLWGTFRALKQAGPPPAELREAALNGELAARHMPALLAVAGAGPLSVSELAQRLGLSLSATSAIVGRLSRAGFVMRAEDEKDRRRTIVAMEEDYRQAIVTWREQTLAPLRGTLERLAPSARRAFLEGWRILNEEARLAAGGADGE